MNSLKSAFWLGVMAVCLLLQGCNLLQSNLPKAPVKLVYVALTSGINAGDSVLVPNLEMYVDSLAKALMAQQIMVRRLTEVETTATLDTSRIDWAEALAPLHESSIHRPGQAEGYTATLEPPTGTGNALGSILVFQSIDPKAAVRMMRLRYVQGRPTELEVLRLVTNSLSTSEWRYHLNLQEKTYAIKGSQRLTLGTETPYRIELSW